MYTEKERILHLFDNSAQLMMHRGFLWTKKHFTAALQPIMRWNQIYIQIEQKQILTSNFIPAKSEKEPVPSRVGTVAALTIFLPIKSCEGAGAPRSNCFRSFTKWSFSTWGCLSTNSIELNENKVIPIKEDKWKDSTTEITFLLTYYNLKEKIPL